ncbi:MAG: lytic transglycosylase domain-containing protein [Chitinophagaceae bacterium]|jgi:membrane-bound lytic murein transglycosylase D|nr:lytic transglycosylase domain-containing protein [Chitinophagaceae bacterium]
MVKKLFLSLTCGFFFFSLASAKEIPQNPLQTGPNPSTKNFTDSLVTDSLIAGVKHLDKSNSVIVKDPKNDFKDMMAYSSSDGAMYELNPRVESFVEDYTNKNATNLEKMKDWGRPYFNMMDEIFTRHGLPLELKYLSVIESKLKSNAVSWAGAVGPWQFMPATAKGLGLRVTKYNDDRRDYYKSTQAAARYLKQLYNTYGDWLLVIAAYNCGPGGVNNAIRKSGSNDFYKLQYSLPAETRNHVKKFIATHHIMEGDGGMTTLTKFELKDRYLNPVIISTEENLVDKIQDAPGTKKITISGKYNSMVISKQIAYDIAAFNRLNPNFDAVMAHAGNYDLRLPVEKMDQFLANKYIILNESLQILLNAANNTKIEGAGKVSKPVKKS